MGCVYVLTSPSNKRYVGMTQRLRTDRPLSRAVAKYGWDAFTKEIVFRSDDKAALIAKEVALIAEFGCMVPDGYNCTAGGEGTARFPRPPHAIEAIRRAHTGKVVSEETRAKLRAAHARNPRRSPMAGKRHSPETIAKLIGRKVSHTAATRARMSRSRMGHAVSDETREKLRLAASSQTPEVRARIADGMKRVWAERRANG